MWRRELGGKEARGKGETRKYVGWGQSPADRYQNPTVTNCVIISQGKDLSFLPGCRYLKACFAAL